MSQTLVSVVDDDESVRESVPGLVRALGFHVRAFSSAEEYLASDVIDASDCLVLDVAMPGMSGPDLYQELRGRGLMTPVIFITAQGNLDLCAELIRRGAADCFYKPFDPQKLIAALRAAMRLK
jgi:FixJ family two-component response regulator